MPHTDAQHLLPQLPPNDGTPDDAPTRCADCGEVVPEHYPVYVLWYYDPSTRRPESQDFATEADARQVGRARTLPRVVRHDCPNCRENFEHAVESGACEREASDGSNHCRRSNPDPCALCMERRRRGIE
jgi:hypothetical protein